MTIYNEVRILCNLFLKNLSSNLSLQVSSTVTRVTAISWIIYLNHEQIPGKPIHKK